MGTYKTAPLVDYELSFQDIAERLFHLAENRLRRGVGVTERSSYSFRLLPILFESGVGSDVMKPIAAPIVGGMIYIHNPRAHPGARLLRDNERASIETRHNDQS